MDWDVHPRVAENVRTTCFKWFSDIKNIANAAEVKQSVQLVNALCHFYDRED